MAPGGDIFDIFRGLANAADRIGMGPRRCSRCGANLPPIGGESLCEACRQELKALSQADVHIHIHKHYRGE